MISEGSTGLCLRDVSLGYPGRKPVLEALNIDTQPGSLVVLVGPNGSGKSTLLFGLGGLLRPRSGSLSLGGRDLYRLPRAERSRLVSVVLTESLKPEWMSAREIAALGRHPHTGVFGRLDAADWRIVDESLEKAGASALAARHFSQLSDGERQKVLIARALAQDCPLLLMDEPTVFLDAPSKRLGLGLLSRLAHEEGKTIVAALHEIELGLEFADRLWLADPGIGGIVQGLPEELALGGDIARAFGLGMDDLFSHKARVEGDITIRLLGPESQERFWTKALLKRMGYAVFGVETEGPAWASLRVEPGMLEFHGSTGRARWTWKEGGMESAFFSLSALAEGIKRSAGIAREGADSLV